jgi:hypothetical protein
VLPRSSTVIKTPTWAFALNCLLELAVERRSAKGRPVSLPRWRNDSPFLRPPLNIALKTMAAQSPFDDIIILDDSSSVVDSDVEGDEATQTSDADAVTFSTQHDTQDGSADFYAPSSSSRRPSRSGQSCPLSFLPLRDWDPASPPSESPPTLFRYAIEWRLTYNNRSKARNTEQEVVLAPCDY